MTRKVLIIAGDTDGNLGDLAIQTATFEQLRVILPEIRISITPAKPQRDRERLAALPLRRGWRGIPSLIRAARSADLVICGGGGLFQDDDSLIKMSYWAIRLFLMRLLSDPIARLSIGAGPLDRSVSRLFARLAIQQLKPVSVRDPLAKSVLAPLTRKRIEVVPDPAVLLNALPRNRALTTLRNSNVPVDQTPLMGVAVRLWFHKYSSLIPYKFAAKLGLQKNRGHRQMSAFIELVAATLDEVSERMNAPRIHADLQC